MNKYYMAACSHVGASRLLWERFIKGTMPVNVLPSHQTNRLMMSVSH